MSRIIKTELTSPKAYDICRSILGQMSDGYWENDHKMEAYWRFIAVAKENGNVAFKISENCFANPYFNRRWIKNDVMLMRDSEILGFFAKKIKFILRKEFAGIKRADDMKTEWLSSSCDNDIRVSDVEDVIRSLNASAIVAGIAESSVD